MTLTVSYSNINSISYNKLFSIRESQETKKRCVLRIYSTFTLREATKDRYRSAWPDLAINLTSSTTLTIP